MYLYILCVGRKLLKTVVSVRVDVLSNEIPVKKCDDLGSMNGREEPQTGKNSQRTPSTPTLPCSKMYTTHTV